MNSLYYGDNLDIMRRHMVDESIDLIYLDPPFNSNRDYNVLFREQSGDPSEGQIKAFTDSWEWSERAYTEFCTGCQVARLVELVSGLVRTMGRNDVTAYLVMMAPRLVEMRRVLRQTGSMYLHCDPTASHYLKLILDAIFGARSFQNEIIWWYRKWSASRTRFLRNHDVILLYSKGPSHTFNVQYVELSPSTVRRFGGRRQDFADEARTRKVATEHESAGSYMPDVWPINLLPAASSERLGYPTQKPLALLDRIVRASSNPGDVVLDPFCGCGTAIVAAEQLRRQWIGIDITHLAVAAVKGRLRTALDIVEGRDYAVVGEPQAEAEARALAEQDKHEFQRWAVGRIGAIPYQNKKGSDRGIDGLVYFKDGPDDPKKCVVQVKGGSHVGVKDIRDLRGVIEREEATLGLYLALTPPTAPMLLEAESFGFYRTPFGDRLIQRLQIRTVAQVLAGQGFDLPSAAVLSGSRAAMPITRDPGQRELDVE